MMWRYKLATAIVGGRDPDDLVRGLTGLVDPEALRAFREACDAAHPPHEGSLDAAIPAAHRAKNGIYFTPVTLADRMAALFESGLEGHVVDLSCGDGALLAAVARRHPRLALRGVEKDPLLAVAAAARILSVRGGRPHPGDYVWCGDGLAERRDLEGAAAVIQNPPYVGEKGNKPLFDELRAAHRHLEPWFGPRIDLHYLFLHRALDILRPGGTMVNLTSEYWLAATGAARLRRDLVERSVATAFERLGTGAFDAAPGHHSLIFVAKRRPTSEDALELPPDGAPWAPFAPRSTLEGVPFAKVCRDRQGFVSGADRVTSRTAAKVRRPAGTPIFLYRDDEVPSDFERLFRPVLRRSDCVANRVFFEPPAGERVLWLDGEAGGDDLRDVEALLAPFRPILEARREVRSGHMPWYRIWWPRVTAEYAQPKLVVPRRATTAAFCLDLSGAMVSSDCTYILAAPGLDPIPTLLAVMLVANAPQTVEHLRHYGKTKGDVIEFYADPLQRLPLEVDVADGRVQPRDPGIRERHERALAALTGPPSPTVDV